jgi:acetate kinase
MKSLVINAGSSSIKFQVFEEETSILSGLCDAIGLDNSKIKYKFQEKKEELVLPLENHKEALEKVIEILKEKKLLEGLEKVIHRIVHGGEEFKDTTLITPEVIIGLKRLIPLAPLHNPANIEGIELMTKLLPEAKQIGVFDTAFHTTMPEKAYLYGTPYSWYKNNGVRRYGFHGSSHQYVIGETIKLLENPEAKIINCHLGNGASTCASVAGKSIDTSMGMTPLEGSIMGTRCGNLDAGVVLHMIQTEGKTADEVARALNKQSGLKGLSEFTSDMRMILDKKDVDEAAKRALDVFIYRLVQIIGSNVAVMNGVDAIVFTGGIGENSAPIRKMLLEKLTYLGIDVDEEANNNREQLISKETSKVKVFVIETDEELQMVRNSKNL